MVFADIPVTEPLQHYKEFMYELGKLKQELEREREMRRKLESRLSRQSRKIKELKLSKTSKEETLKNPPIRLRLETVTKGNYISTLSEYEICHIRNSVEYLPLLCKYMCTRYI